MGNIFGTDDAADAALDALAHQADVEGGLPSAIPVLSTTGVEHAQAIATSIQAQGTVPPWHDPYQQVVVYGAPMPPDPGAPPAPPGGWPTAPPVFPFLPKMDGPPPYADAEVAALATIAAALEELDPIARKRVLRYLASKYGAAE